MKDVEDMMKVIRHKVQLIMSDDDNVVFTNANVCHLCERPLTDHALWRNDAGSSRSKMIYCCVLLGKITIY